MSGSSNTKICVTTEILIARANDATRKIDIMENRLNSIERIVSSTKSYWVGEAGDACRRRYESELEVIQEIMKRLKGQPGTLLTIANVYQETEEEAVSVSRPLPENVID